MAIIKWRKNEIVLVDQSDGLIDAVNQHFLCNELEAKFDGKNTYIFKDPDPDLFEGLQEYLSFIGVKPDFEENRVYMHGITKQLNYQRLRFKAMLESPGYFNHSLWDTISGEYYRSLTEKKDYYHIFDYWRWDEKLIENTLDQYDWERSPETNTTWRIGDGTAGFYNYLYYIVAGFTEHDTFRSNQIREGQISRDEALALVEDENRPRYQNIRWYLDALELDFKEVIEVVNLIPRLYNDSQ